MAEDRVNLEQSTVLLVDDNPQALDMLSSVFLGFGVKEQIKCASAVEAVKVVQKRQIDLVVIDCGDPEMDSYAFTRWLRRETPAPLRYIPVILLTGHASQAKVQEGRDCGVSFVVTKPLTPAVLLKRILWLAGDEREFVEAASYVGPDRRVRNFGPPIGVPGRRKGDLSTHVGAAVEANMDQADIDMLLKPMRVSL
ncbi:response regulator [Brevundimonas naejangsanensis]|uniref:Response regulator n=1 Tax=Brevundimonas naejangsanensis TaxID=588932 RepID=A0A494RJ70_9CAUL|nr:response regulator [Brevundimonas naejangsanensis]AYG95083.1 response regulator [Brevundimonas naejangsanensis]